MTAFLHTMIRVTDPEATINFFKLLGLEGRRVKESDPGRFTLYFLGVPGEDAEIELTHNWDGEGEDFGGGRNFGHLAFEVDDIYATCEKLQAHGVTINRPPREGRMAFVKTPDGISIELLNKGGAQEPKEPWASMENVGTW
ncbi:VOC family protein [Sphingomicrobium aestuariivivum]|uniref:VOC family protein n=1 Tax=Sphingomicrobium aestuariivivum TaxID=1582356 RepID=UPI001FD63FFF|nr:VOC family protein [Sphingomicrobium aestuariivivum]MCJ8190994.1 VOC family protein [Sphingomicrobium aestuariivivum]